MNDNNSSAEFILSLLFFSSSSKSTLGLSNLIIVICGMVNLSTISSNDKAPLNSSIIPAMSPSSQLALNTLVLSLLLFFLCIQPCSEEYLYFSLSLA